MLSIVVPTYCEADNIEELVTRVSEAMTQHDYEIVVVDDNSPDNTAGVVNELASSFPVRLIQPTGRPRDLSLSVIDGIRAAKSDHVLVMDADHSHPPEKVPELYEKLLEDETSFVIGSRYVEDGSFDREWTIWRFLNSHIATLLCRPLVKCEDPMSGFFALDRRRIDDYDRLKPIGYKIGLELMVRGSFSSVKEVPIRFKDRAIGESKMTFGQQLKFIRHLRRLYIVHFGSFAEFVNYGMVGASGFIVDLIFYYFFQAVGVNHQVARGLSFWPAVTWNWRLNRMATFGERRRRPKAKQWLEFVLASLLGFSLNWGLYVTLTSQVEFFDTYRFLALITGIGAASFFNFAMSSLYVYNEKRL